MYKQLEKRTFFAYALCFFILTLIGFVLYSKASSSPEVDQIYFLKGLNLESIALFLHHFLFKIFVISLVGFFHLYLYKNIGFSNRNSLMPFYVYLVCILFMVIFSSSFYDFIQLIFMILTLVFLLNTTKENQTTSSFFNIGFIFGTLILISLQNLIFLPILFFSINIFGKNAAKDFWGFILGTLTPVFMILSSIYIFNSQDLKLDFVNSIKQFDFELATGVNLYRIILVAILGIICFPFVHSFNITGRKFLTVLLSIFILLLIYNLFFSYGQSKSFILLMYILSLYLTTMIYNLRNSRAKNFLLFIGLAFSILITFVYT